MKYIFLSMLSIALILASCSKEDDEAALPGNVKDIRFIDVKSYTNWVYFSFAKSEVVAVTDYANDLSWDIAFHRGDVRINGGASGRGKAEVINTKSTDWKSVVQVPSSGYVKDEVGKITTAFTGGGTTEEDQPFSQTLSGWLTVDTSNPPPKYVVNNWIYVMKAADGKYVKLWIYDNKNEKNVSGYVSFKYQYNESGATTF